MKRLAVVGGGAAGLSAAIAAGERARQQGLPLQVTVFERDDRVGRSILATGNGRCNFSNSQLRFYRYHNHVFVGQVIGRIAGVPEDDVVHVFFREHGLEWREEADGRLYPQANKASVVVDVLRASAAAAGVREACEREVAAVEPPRSPEKPFTLRMSDGVFERADAVIVACGGRAMASLKAADLEMLPPQPVLGPLRCADADLALTRELDNIRVRCIVSLFRPRDDCLAHIATEEGELMFRKYGVSGICVYDLSRFAQPGDTLSVNLLPQLFVDELPGQLEDDVNKYLEERWRLLRESLDRPLTHEDMLRGLVLPRVADALLKRAGRKPTDPFGEKDVPDLRYLLTMLHLEVAGVGDADQCQVRRGGLNVERFDPQTMGARGIPGLYAAGEALDVDGPCGGYNLHWAWASGLRAGRSAADWLAE